MSKVSVCRLAAMLLLKIWSGLKVCDSVPALLEADQAAWRENLPELQRWLVLADATYLPMCANDSRDRDAAFWSNAAKKFSRTWYETLADRQTSPAAWESQAFLLSASEWQKHLGKKDLGGLSSDALQKVQEELKRMRGRPVTLKKLNEVVSDGDQAARVWDLVEKYGKPMPSLEAAFENAHAAAAGKVSWLPRESTIQNRALEIMWKESEESTCTQCYVARDTNAVTGSTYYVGYRGTTNVVDALTDAKGSLRVWDALSKLPQPGDPVEVFDGGSKDTGSWKQATACGSGSDGAAVVAELDDGDDPNKREWKIWRRPVLDPDVS